MSTPGHLTGRCRSRHPELRLVCERNRGHEGTHRAETGEPLRRQADGGLRAMVATWYDRAA